MDLFPIDESKEEASYLSQVFVGMVDVVLSLGLFALVFSLQFRETLIGIFSVINPILLLVLWLAIYRLLSFAIFGRTIGMKLFNIVLLNGEEQALSFKEKILASVFILYKGVRYYKD